MFVAQIKQNGSKWVQYLHHPNLSCKATKAPLQCLVVLVKGQCGEGCSGKGIYLHSQWKRSDSKRQHGFMKRACLIVQWPCVGVLDSTSQPTTRLGLLLEHFHNGRSLHNFLNFQISHKMLLDLGSESGKSPSHRWNQVTTVFSGIPLENCAFPGVWRQSIWGSSWFQKAAKEHLNGSWLGRIRLSLQHQYINMEFMGVSSALHNLNYNLENTLPPSK